MTRRVPLVDLDSLHRPIRDELLEALARCLDRQNFILGEDVARLEEAAAAYCEVPFVLGVSSGTDALLVSLMAYGIGPGDEVVTSPFSFFATAGTIARLGATPVFVDIEEESFNIDPARLEEKLTDRSRVIVPVHLYGQCAEMAPILALAEERGLVVIEDAAQAIGATDRGRRVGGLGDVGCFSFYPTKNLGAFGDAGMVVTSDPGLAARARAVRTYGWECRDMSMIEGINSRLDELQAAVLTEKLPFLDDWNQRRYEHAMQYKQLLGDLPVRLPAIAPGALHVFHLFVVRTPERDRLMKFLGSRGIGTLVHYPVPLHLQPAYAGLGYREGSFPVAERAQKEILSLPLYPELTRAELEEVCSAIRAFFGDAP
jgi:dTDP-4-amino-4,6-dideoxygalactose transaminase